MENEVIVYGVYNFNELYDNCWSGARATLDKIEELGKENELMDLINSILEDNKYNNITWTETKLNDFIWFDTDFIEEQLDIKLWEE